MNDPQQMACPRCAVSGLHYSEETSKTQASKQGLLTRTDYHSEVDCIKSLSRSLSDVLSELRRVAVR